MEATGTMLRPSRATVTSAKGSSFLKGAGNLKLRASAPRAAPPQSGLRVVCEKVVGIDLGTTNSAVRTIDVMFSPRAPPK